MQYWLHIDGTQHGPFQMEELVKAGITPDTYVWREGLEDWIMAKELDELAILFTEPETAQNDFGNVPLPGTATPPAIPSQPLYVVSSQPFTPPCPPTNLVWAIIVTVLCCQIFGIVAIIYATQVKTKYAMGQYEKAVKESLSIAEVCRKLNIKPIGGNYKTVSKAIKEYNIDISHFTGRAWNQGKRYRMIVKPKPLNEILCENSNYNNYSLIT